MFRASDIRDEFPALSRTFKNRPVVFADNAATSLKPRCVIEAVEHYYRRFRQKSTGSGIEHK